MKQFILESERLRIRRFKLADAAEYFKMTRDPLIQEYVPFACENSLEETQEVILNYYSSCDCTYDFFLVIEEKETQKLVGAIIAISLTSYNFLEVSILTEQSSRRKGYMYEALCTFKDAFEPSTKLLFVIEKDNIASLNTVTKLEGISEEPSDSLNLQNYRTFSLIV